MIDRAWPDIRQGRLGIGVVLDAEVLWALRVGEAPQHERVKNRAVFLAESGLPLIVCYLSLAAVAAKVQAQYGGSAALAVLRETRELFNVMLPGEDDLRAAEEVLAGGVEQLDLEQAVAGVLARRLGCSIYGFSPAYHLLRVPVVLD